MPPSHLFGRDGSLFNKRLDRPGWRPAVPSTEQAGQGASEGALGRSRWFVFGGALGRRGFGSPHGNENSVHSAPDSSQVSGGRGGGGALASRLLHLLSGGERHVSRQ